VNVAATWHSERKPKEGIEVYKKALAAQLWMVGPWKDLGDLLGLDPWVSRWSGSRARLAQSRQTTPSGATVLSDSAIAVGRLFIPMGNYPPERAAKSHTVGSFGSKPRLDKEPRK
jgi:hypothetical protein